jgi:hypothetical protein
LKVTLPFTPPPEAAPKKVTVVSTHLTQLNESVKAGLDAWLPR